ncbi:Flp pilus assembly protein protease CpaA [Desulfohalotomaculum tongense]|uniref:prepilin peptidase n=1 Tax=Desulforadius tongensis TaxID=1216062 RepID=UPI0019570A30|nr:A24 family peptidase [Desulforadius tongensis]MBM7854937.1 Flp pilus assembly protein protease CpaA [Desulforadius tongensis]
METFTTFSFSLPVPVIISILGALVSVYTDLRWRKIKNFVTLPLIILGWSWSLYVGGPKAFLINVLVSVFIGATVTLTGYIGAGDIKLIVGIAACLQPPLSLYFQAFFFVCLLAAALFIRFKACDFKFGNAISAMKAEIVLGFSGVKDPSKGLYKKPVSHTGAPIIFFALVFCLARKEGLV